MTTTSDTPARIAARAWAEHPPTGDASYDAMSEHLRERLHTRMGHVIAALEQAGLIVTPPDEEAVQLAFDLPGLGLILQPTIAMRNGEQEVFQHSWCGTVVVRSNLAHAGALGPCPSCTRPSDPWWQQEIRPEGFSGLHLLSAGAR